MDYKDFLGNDIKVGSTVVYPGRQGSNLWMNKGTVEALEESHRWNWSIAKIKIRRIPTNKYEKVKSVWVECLNRVVVVGAGHGI